GNKPKFGVTHPPQQYLQQYLQQGNLKAHFQKYIEKVTVHQAHVRAVWEQQQATYQAQAGQDFEDNIMDLLNRELNSMFFTPGGSSSQGGQ
ncbi:hypothetical protein A2U01_0057240, partial [Trifolium medium]|nr:hypothetical protein [Trifolium medium]